MIKFLVATLKHLEVIVQYQCALALETESLKLNRDTVTRGVQSLIENQAMGHYLLIEYDQKIVGTTMILKEWSDWRAQEVWWIHSLYIQPDCRGKRLYSALYEDLQLKAKNEPKCAGIRLYVDRSNSHAIQVYQKLGMNDQHYTLFEWLKSD